MIRKILLLSAFIVFLPSCYTIHFSRSNTTPHYQSSQWHHIGLLGLVEFSDPVNLEQICPADSWGSVRTQTGFLQGLVKILSVPTGQTAYSYNYGTGSNITVPVTVQVGQFYSPEEVSVSCQQRQVF